MGEQIPLNSQLTIDLELVSWRNVIDVLGDKKIMKKIIKTGEGFDRPNQGSLVKGNLFIDSASIYCISFERNKNPQKNIYIETRLLCSAVIYIGKLEDGEIFQRKGSDEEPFEYLCLEGN